MDPLSALPLDDDDGVPFAAALLDDLRVAALMYRAGRPWRALGVLAAAVVRHDPDDLDRLVEALDARP
jgi:hypothetical protein